MSANKINSKMVPQLFEDLNLALKEKGLQKEITIFGSGAMLAQGISRPNRNTVDIDLAMPDMDMEFQVMAADVGSRHNLDLTWINSAGVIFSRNFPNGWQERTVTIFEGDALIVKSLGRKDLVATKFNALCSRDQATDRDDLVDLQPSKQEMEFAKNWVLSLKDKSQDFKERVEKLAIEVLKDARGRSV